jgi:hypothetical protein
MLNINIGLFNNVLLIAWVIYISRQKVYGMVVNEDVDGGIRTWPTV